MFFLMGSTFIFGSWICEADGDDKLQGCLLEDSEHQDKIFLVGINLHLRILDLRDGR
jgi:hypothetical protein